MSWEDFKGLQSLVDYRQQVCVVLGLLSSDGTASFCTCTSRVPLMSFPFSPLSLFCGLLRFVHSSVGCCCVVPLCVARFRNVVERVVPAKISDRVLYHVFCVLDTHGAGRINNRDFAAVMRSRSVYGQIADASNPSPSLLVMLLQRILAVVS